MKKIIDKVLRREDDTKLCPSCENPNDVENSNCGKCGYEFNTPVKSNPEDGL